MLVFIRCRVLKRDRRVLLSVRPFTLIWSSLGVRLVVVGDCQSIFDAKRVRRYNPSLVRCQRCDISDLCGSFPSFGSRFCASMNLMNQVIREPCAVPACKIIDRAWLLKQDLATAASIPNKHALYLIQRKSCGG